MAANREAQRKATHNEGDAKSILKVSVQQMYMYLRGHNHISHKVQLRSFNIKSATSKTNNIIICCMEAIHPCCKRLNN